MRLDDVAEVVRIPRGDENPIVMLQDSTLTLWREGAAGTLQLLREPGLGRVGRVRLPDRVGTVVVPCGGGGVDHSVQAVREKFRRR